MMNNMSRRLQSYNINNCILAYIIAHDYTQTYNDITKHIKTYQNMLKISHYTTVWLLLQD